MSRWVGSLQFIEILAIHSLSTILPLVNPQLAIETLQNKAEQNYRQTSNISRTLCGDKIIDHSGVVGASPVGAAPTTSSFST